MGTATLASPRAKSLKGGRSRWSPYRSKVNLHPDDLQVLSWECREIDRPLGAPLGNEIDQAIGDDGVAPDPSTPDLTSITATSGTDPTPTGSNEYTVPAGYTGLAVWIGVRPIDEQHVQLHVKVGGGASRPYELHRHQCIIINANAGQVVSFASQVKTKVSATESSLAVGLVVTPIAPPVALTPPTQVSGTANCDRNGAVETGSPTWAPLSANAHIVLASENQVIQINGASGHRFLHVIEHDGAGNRSPIRFVYCPPNRDVRLQCRHKRISLANFEGATVSVTAPTGAVIGGVSEVWRPAFTATTPASVATVAEFKTAANGSADDVILAAGTYDLTAAGDAMNGTNYAAAMNKDLRIRSATGNPSDVTFVCPAGWNAIITVGKRWVLEGFTVNIASAPSVGFQITGRADGVSVNITGTPAGAAVPSFAIVGTVSLGEIVNTFAWGSVSGAVEDAIDLNQGGQPARQTTGRILGYTINGNGISGSNSQVLTAHTGSSVEAYGVRITDTGLTGNQVTIAADASSYVYVYYSYCYSADIANAVGPSITANGVFWCLFEAMHRVVVGDSTRASSGAYVIGLIGTQKTSVAIAMVLSNKTDIYPYISSCTLVTSTVSSSHALDCQGPIEVVGTQFTISGTSNSSVGIRITAGSPTSGTVVLVRNCRFRCATTGARMIEMGTSANISLQLYNVIFETTTSTYSIGATGTTDNVAENCYFGTASFPTNFATRFPGVGTITSNVDGALNYWSGGTGSGLEADDVPSVGGLSDTEGKDLSLSGGVDRYGRDLWLGGEFVRGPLERTAIKSSAQMYPAIW